MSCPAGQLVVPQMAALPPTSTLEVGTCLRARQPRGRSVIVEGEPEPSLLHCLYLFAATEVGFWEGSRSLHPNVESVPTGARGQ